MKYNRSYHIGIHHIDERMLSRTSIDDLFSKDISQMRQLHDFNRRSIRVFFVLEKERTNMDGLIRICTLVAFRDENDKKKRSMMNDVKIRHHIYRNYAR